MIIFTQNRSFRVAPKLAEPSPWLPVTCADGLAAESLLAEFAGDVRFAAALRREMAALPGPPVIAWPARAVAAQAATAISRGAIRIAFELSDVIELFFDAHRPIGDDRDCAVFPEFDATARFLAALQRNPRNEAALAAAMAHVAGLRHLSRVRSVGGRLAAADEARTNTVKMLVAQKLMLQPVGVSRRRFQLLWDIQRVAGSAPASPAPPPPPRVAPSSPGGPAPASTLPDAPADITAQALALLAAAANGTPFCAECATQNAAADG
jgi:hypothetical protein